MRSKLIYLVSFILVLGLIGTSVAQNIDPSLVGWWTFDEGSGSVAKDTSGKSVDATFFGDPSWGQDSDHRGVLLFDGTDDYVFIDGLFQVPIYTISLWFRVDNGSGQRDIFSAYAAGVQHGILLEMQADGTLRYLHRYPLGTGGGTNIYTTTTYDDGAWYHATMVKSVDTIRLYINGEELDSAADNSEFNPGDAFGVALGCLDDERGLERMFPGAMDDVRIYNRVLSNEEIRALMDLEPWPYAWGPTPADGTLHPETWVNLSWTPGYYASSHDIYLSDNFDDVNDGAESAFIGNQTTAFLVVGFPGFAYPEGLTPGVRYYWRIDEVDDTNPDSPWKGDVWSFLVPPKIAYEPIPADGAKFVDTDVEITWTPGFDAKLHTVYFGDNFDDVNNAAGGTAQTVATYVPGTLEPDKTYYWRVDEFDIATTYKGDVWSFTTAGEGGGLRAEYFQGVGLSNQVANRVDPKIDFTWTEAPVEGLTGINNFSVRWVGEVEAAFTETYTFYTNSADGVRLWIDGRQIVNNWTDHDNTENSGNIDLVAGQTYSLVMEYYDNADAAVAQLLWSSPHTPKQTVPQAALSLPVRASQARPSNGSVDVSQTVILNWGSGEAAVSHDVYFGMDEEAVKNADNSSPEYKGNQNLESMSYDPGKLEWDTTYYWRIDEIEDNGTVQKGNIWSFTTANFLIVDDMEAYNDLAPDDPASNRIFNAWLDGFEDPTNGSLVGYENPPFAEQTIVHTGNQAMPFAYNNAVGKSEATLTLTETRNWTENGVDVLTIWYRGDTTNTPETMYVVLNGSAGVDNGNPDSVLVNEWTEWNIALQMFADQGVNLSNVDTTTLGFGNRSNPVAGGAGTVFFDDIRLYRSTP